MSLHAPVVDRGYRSGEGGILTPEDYRTSDDDRAVKLIDAQRRLLNELRAKADRLEKRNSDLELRLRGVPMTKGG